MSKRLCAVAAAALALAGTVYGQNAQPALTLEARILESSIVGVLEEGTIEFDIANLTGEPMRDVQLTLVAPVTGLLDHGRSPVAIGELPANERVARRFDFVLHGGFRETREPLSLRVSYLDQQGSERELALETPLAAGGGL